MATVIPQRPTQWRRVWRWIIYLCVFLILGFTAYSLRPLNSKEQKLVVDWRVKETVNDSGKIISFYPNRTYYDHLQNLTGSWNATHDSLNLTGIWRQRISIFRKKSHPVRSCFPRIWYYYARLESWRLNRDYRRPPEYYEIIELTETRFKMRFSNRDEQWTLTGTREQIPQ